MGKKTASKKTAKKTTARKAAPKKSSAKKAVTKKPAAKKPAASKTSTPKKSTAKAKPAAPKPAAPKSGPKKKPAADPDKKPATKPGGKPASKTSAPKPDEAKTTKPAAAADKPVGDDPKKPGRKGITIVSDKPARKPRPKPVTPAFPPPGPRLLGPGSPIRRPLIPSGPRVERREDDDDAANKRKKSPFNKRQLDRFKEILIAKRHELIGDVEQMETDALRSSSGGLSHTPQHIAEQGSDSADQSLSLNLAAADRRLIKEIDAALARIADKTYGLCELTGEAIGDERLEELPWARYSIEAARRLEQPGGPR